MTVYSVKLSDITDNLCVKPKPVSVSSVKSNMV